MKHQKLYRLVLAALFAALIFVATNIIRVPIPATDGYINLGDCVVLLGAFLLGPVYGAAAGGVGSMMRGVLPLRSVETAAITPLFSGDAPRTVTNAPSTGSAPPAVEAVTTSVPVAL